MSGQPLKTPSDATKYRSEYMENLALQSRIDQQNLQANTVYLQTGQLPPSTQMTDTRTTAEKLLDTEYLKQNLVKDLAPVAEPSFALRIIQGVEKSPLNINNTFIKWLAQNTPEIVNNLRKKYKYGIAGDENDADTIVQVMSSIFGETKNSMQSVKDYMNSSSTTQQGGTRGVLSQNDYQQVMEYLVDIIKDIFLATKKLERNVKDERLYPGNETREYNQLIQDNYHSLEHIKTIITEMKNILPSTEQITQLLNRLSSHEHIELGNLDIADYFENINLFPKSYSLITMLGYIKKNLKNITISTLRDTTVVVRQLYSLVSFMTDAKINQLYDLKRNIFNEVDEDIRDNKRLESIQTIDEIKRAQQEARDERKAQRVYVINPQDDAVWTRQTPAGRLGGPWGDESDDGGVWRNVPSEISTDETNTMRSIHSDSTGSIPSLIEPVEYERRRQEYNQLTNQQRQGDLILPNGETYNYFANPNMGPSSGNGIKRRGRIRGTGVSPIPKPPTFVGFGINEINQKLLDKNILSIRRDTRSKIKDMNNRHISEGMKRVIKSIIGGGTPQYNDLSSLEEDEKNYLNKIVSASNLHEKLSVPAPSKDQRDKDFHQFEVMKGEILSGNDNKEMIKKFKLLCVKLMRQGALPKAEVHELMEALVDLGY